jgi:hypothetical protein
MRHLRRGCAAESENSDKKAGGMAQAGTLIFLPKRESARPQGEWMP